MGFMFDIFPVFFIIIFVVVIGGFVVMAVKGLGQWNQNNQSPVLTVEAVVAAKRTNHSTHMQQVGDMNVPTTDTTYYVTFEVQSGSRLEFHVKGREYGQLREGDRGMLTFQGTRYQGFERMG